MIGGVLAVAAMLGVSSPRKRMPAEPVTVSVRRQRHRVLVTKAEARAHDALKRARKLERQRRRAGRQ